MRHIAVTRMGYTAELDTATDQVVITDAENHVVGTGRWQRGTIDLCPAILRGKHPAGTDAAHQHSARAYEALDVAMQDALDEE